MVSEVKAPAAKVVALVDYAKRVNLLWPIVRTIAIMAEVPIVRVGTRWLLDSDGLAAMDRAVARYRELNDSVA